MRREQSIYLGFAALAVVLGYAIAAIGQTATATVVLPEDIGDAAGALAAGSALVEAFKSKAWGLFAALILTFIVAGARLAKLTSRLPRSAQKWVAMGLAVAASVAVGLQTGLPWWELVLTGITAGTSAIGLHQLSKRPERG